MRQPPHRFLDLVYAWVVGRLDKEGREQFDMDMAERPPDVEVVRMEDVSEAVREEEGAAFMAVASMPGG